MRFNAPRHQDVQRKPITLSEAEKERIRRIRQQEFEAAMRRKERPSDGSLYVTAAGLLECEYRNALDGPIRSGLIIGVGRRAGDLLFILDDRAA